MTDKEHQSRIEALAHAVRHPSSIAKSADEIVKDAEKYLKFLQGETAPAPV